MTDADKRRESRRNLYKRSSNGILAKSAGIGLLKDPKGVLRRNREVPWFGWLGQSKIVKETERWSQPWHRSRYINRVAIDIQGLLAHTEPTSIVPTLCQFPERNLPVRGQYPAKDVGHPISEAHGGPPGAGPSGKGIQIYGI